MIKIARFLWFKSKNIFIILTFCRLTLCRTFDPLSFDPVSFDPLSFDPGSFDPLSVNHVQEVYFNNDLCTGKVLYYWLIYRKWTALLINAQEVYVNIGLCTGSVLHDWECTAVLPASSPRQCSRNPVLLVLLLAGLADVCKQLVCIKQV